MYKRKRAGNTITRKINSTKDTAAKADKNHYISNSYLEGFIPIDTEYFTASNPFRYLDYVLTVLKDHQDDTDYSFIEELLPWSDQLPEICRSKSKTTNL